MSLKNEGATFRLGAAFDDTFNMIPMFIDYDITWNTFSSDDTSFLYLPRRSESSGRLLLCNTQWAVVQK
jgi:hypothetical protein